MICIYHSKDLDGMSSGAIVKYKYPDCQLIGYDYGEPIPELPQGEAIIMVDVTFPIPVMQKIQHRLTVIDHHQSFIEGWKEATKLSAYRIGGRLQTGKAACELTWEFFFPYQPIPEWITLLGMYDTWRNTDQVLWKTGVLPFQYGLRALVNSPEDLLESYLDEDKIPQLKLFPGDVQEITRDGIAIARFVKQSDIYNCSRNAFIVEFEGLRTICVNTVATSIATFESVYDPLKHDLMMGFNYTGEFWKISLRSVNGINCFELAKKYDGGGHPEAAGFQVMDINELIRI